MRKTIGKAIIGITITLAIALLPLLVSGNEPITGTGYYAPYYVHLSGDRLFRFILFIGLSLTGIVILIPFKKIYKRTFYPAFIGVISGIISGLIFPVEVSGWSRLNVFDFNNRIFLTIFGVSLFISLMSLGISLLKDDKITH